MRIVKLFVLGTLLIGGLSAYAAPDLTPRTPTSKYYVDEKMSDRQPILNPRGEFRGDYVVTYGPRPGDEGGVEISDLSGNGENIPTVGSVNDALGKKQANLNNTAGKVVTYTTSAGSVGTHDVYQGASASYNANGLVEANHANAAIQKGLDDHLTCNSNHGPNSECWLWDLNEQASNAIYTPNNGN